MRVDRLRAHEQGRGRLEAQQLLSPGATRLGRPGHLQCLRPEIRLPRSPAARTVRQDLCATTLSAQPTVLLRRHERKGAAAAAHRCRTNASFRRCEDPASKEQASPRRYQRRSLGTTGKSADESARDACIARRMRASASIRSTRPNDAHHASPASGSYAGRRLTTRNRRSVGCSDSPTETRSNSTRPPPSAAKSWTPPPSSTGATCSTISSSNPASRHCRVRLPPKIQRPYLRLPPGRLLPHSRSRPR